MKYSEILAGLKELIGDDAQALEALELVNGVAGDKEFSAPMDVESIKRFLKDEKPGQDLMNSLYDVRFSKWEQEKLPSRLDSYYSDRLAKENPPASPEARELAEIKAKMKELETREQRAALKEFAMKQADKLGLPVDIAPDFIRDDEDSTMAALQNRAEVLLGWRDSYMQGKLSGAPSENLGHKTNSGKVYTRDQVEKMSDKELLELSAKSPEVLDSLITE